MRVYLLFCLTVAVVAAKVKKCSSCSKTEDDTSNNDCLSACEPSCENPIPEICTLNCVQRPCTCKKGYYRNEAKKCVPWKECPQLNPCAATSCTVGAVCVEDPIDCGNPPCPTRGRCTSPTKPKPSPPGPGTSPADIPPLTCDNYQCRGCNELCLMVHDEENCKEEKCSQHPECFPLDNTITCASTDCVTGNICRMIPVTCAVCPCYPQPACIPSSSTPNTCGDHETLKTGCVECDKPCPGQSTPEPCMTICDIESCRCLEGFFRDQDTGKCITRNDCESKNLGPDNNGSGGYDRKKKKLH